MDRWRSNASFTAASHFSPWLKKSVLRRKKEKYRSSIMSMAFSPFAMAATCCARGSIMWSNLAAVSSSRGIVDAEGR